MVTSSLERRAWSANSIRFSRSFFCLKSGALASTSSREPCSRISLVAVLAPTPGTPGTLSEASPIRPRTSITLSGVTPNFSRTPSTPTGS